MLLPITAKLRKEEVFSCGLSLEPVINFRAGGVARENRARRGGGRRLWPVHCRGRQRKYGAIFAATRRAGANFPHFGVARHSKIPDIRRSSLLELRKIGSQRRPRES